MAGKKMLKLLNAFGNIILNLHFVPTDLITDLSQDKVQDGLKRS